MKIADKIKKESLSLKDRGINHDSYFHVCFSDGSEVKEDSANWSDISEEQIVDYINGKKMVRVSVHPITSITISHGGLQTTLEVQKDEKVFQAIRSISILSSDGGILTQHVGRVVGLVKNGKIIEERYIDGRTNEVIGFSF